MTRMNRSSSAALFVSLLAIGCGGGQESGNDDSADQGGGSRTVIASQGERLDMLEVLWAVHDASDPRGASVRLFETGGGDPAINGNLLVLTVVPHEPALAAQTWNTGIDVRTVQSVTFDADIGGVVIETTSDTLDENGGVGSVPLEFTASYEVEDQGKIGDRLLVEANGGAAEEIMAADEISHVVLQQIVAIRVENDEPNNAVVRLYETAGGDPALNGNLLLFNVMPFDPNLPSQSWETEIDVRTVEGVKLDTAKSTLRVNTQQDVLKDDVDLASVPLEFALTYSVAKDGTVADKLSIAVR